MSNEPVNPDRSIGSPASGSRVEAALGECYREAAFGDVVRRLNQFLGRERGQQRLQRALLRQIDRAAARRAAARGSSADIRCRPARRGSRPAARSVGVRRREHPSQHRRSSSISPTTPMTGVGRIARPSVSLYRLTLPPVIGISNARHASPMPVDRLDELPHDLRPLGLPKLRLFVAPIGMAPAHATLRAASATAASRRASDRDRQ